ncbi:MAG: prepilin-type N-terminal cleavage/methylation domain-containing protein [Phycisphaerae bacterium]
MKMRRGFTLIEILIVVIILGILAAIVIPQFMNASSEASVSSTQTTLSTVRAQIELFKLQHNDTYPGLAASTNGTTAWAPMLIKTDAVTTSGTTAVATGTFGPYFTVPPTNALNQKAGIVIADLDATAANATTTDGWVWDSTDAKIKAIVPAAWASGKVPFATGGTTLDAKYVGDFTK